MRRLGKTTPAMAPWKHGLIGLAGLGVAGLSSAPALGNSLYEPVLITRISIDASGNAYLMTSPNVPDNHPSYPTPACAVGNPTGYQAIFSAQTPGGQAMLSVALSARLSKTPVRIVSNGVCTFHPNIEGISYLDILPAN